MIHYPTLSSRQEPQKYSLDRGVGRCFCKGVLRWPEANDISGGPGACPRKIWALYIPGLSKFGTVSKFAKIINST